MRVHPRWKHGSYRFFLHRLAQELNKTVAELLELPASELTAWKDYFEIYPFTQDREDFRMSRVIEAINNGTQHLAYKDKKWEYFMPDYLETVDVYAVSEKEQISKEKAFVEKYTQAMNMLKEV